MKKILIKVILTIAFLLINNNSEARPNNLIAALNNNICIQKENNYINFPLLGSANARYLQFDLYSDDIIAKYAPPGEIHKEGLLEINNSQSPIIHYLPARTKSSYRSNC